MKIEGKTLREVTNDDIFDGTFIIPNGVTEIGDYVFWNCTSLENIEIPNSVTEIGDEAFNYCTSLKSITIPNSITKIGTSAFHGCISLKSVEIPNSVREMGDNAFACCISLESITIPNSVTEIGRSIFNGCHSLKSVEIPNGVTKIRAFAFANCTSLESIIIPNTVMEIEWYAFANCFSLKSIEIPNGVTEIEEFAFSNCSSLKSITIPCSITRIIYNAFSCCYDLNINISTSLFCFADNKLSTWNSIKIYGQRINRNNFEQELDNVRRKELLDKISIYLKNKNVTDKKCYELSEHKDFIEKTIYNLKNADGYNYRDDFDEYMGKYILSTMSMYDDKQMEQIFSALNNHQVEALDSSNIYSVVKYGSSLEQYPNYFTGILQLITNHYGLDSSMINMKKTIAEISKPQNLVQLITTVFDSYNGGKKYYLNKSSLIKLEQFADINITKLMYGIEKAEKLKVAIGVYIGKMDGYVKNLLSYDFSQVEEQSLLPNSQNPISIKEDVDERIELYQTNIASMISLYQQVNNLIADNAEYVMKLQGVQDTLLPGVKMASSLGKGVIRTQKNIDMLEEIIASYEDIIEASQGNLDNKNSEAKGKV